MKIVQSASIWNKDIKQHNIPTSQNKTPHLSLKAAAPTRFHAEELHLLLPFHCCHWVNHCYWALLGSQQQPQQSFFKEHQQLLKMLLLFPISLMFSFFIKNVPSYYWNDAKIITFK